MRIYANLLGNWTDITNATVFSGNPALKYFQEVLLTPITKDSKISKLFEYDYINVEYNEHQYRIHPTQIQIVDCD